MPENITTYFFFGTILLFVISYGIRFCRNLLAPTRTVEATVVNKQKVESFSKYSGSGKSTKYAVTFSANGKRLSFYVSEFSYSGYRIGETGTLTYKGDKLINFS